MSQTQLQINDTAVRIALREREGKPCVEVAAICSPDVVNDPRFLSPKPAINDAVLAWVREQLPAHCDVYQVKIRFSTQPEPNKFKENTIYYRNQTVTVDGTPVRFSARLEEIRTYESLEIESEAEFNGDDLVLLNDVAAALTDWVKAEKLKVTSFTVWFKDAASGERGAYSRDEKRQFVVGRKTYYFDNGPGKSQEETFGYAVQTPLPTRDSGVESAILAVLREHPVVKYAVAQLPGWHFQVQFLDASNKTWLVPLFPANSPQANQGFIPGIVMSGSGQAGSFAADPTPSASGTFLINPKNADYLSGKRKTITSTLQRLTTLGVICLVIGVLALLLQQYSVQREQNILNTGVAVNGTIIDTYTTRTRRGGTEFHINYRYQAADGQQYIGSEEVSEEQFNAATAGIPIAIRYEANDPDDHVVTGQFANLTRSNSLFLAALFFGGLGLLMVVISVSGGIRRGQLEKQGKIIDGVITNTSIVRNLFTLALAVQYQFKSPETGEVLTGKTSQIRTDLTTSGDRVIEKATKRTTAVPGSRVAVVYVSRNVHRIL